MAARAMSSAKNLDNESGAVTLTVETPHTERVQNSTSSIAIQTKLMGLGEQEKRGWIKSQIETFTEKVKLCKQSYSSQMAETMIGQLKSADGIYANSIYQLRKLIPNYDESLPTIVYAKWFLNNMEYMKELKTNFDERIYLPLTKHYQHVRQKSNLEEALTNREATTLTEKRLSSASSVLKFKDDLPEVKDLYDFTEVENMASRLVYLRQRWQLLLEDENEINATLFSLKSQISVSGQCSKEVINMLRLVPDILLKCSNAALLAQQWLERASNKVLDLETKYNKLERVKSVLTEKLSGLSEEIKSEEEELQAESTDLEMLADREERPNELMSKTHHLDQTIKQLNSRIHLLTVENEELKDQKDVLKSDDVKRQEISKTIHSNKLQILKLHRDVKMKMYEKELMNEDLSIELEVKPCIIRYTDQIQVKCGRLEQVIDSKRSEKQQVESALVPVMEDSRRTQDLISRVNSVASTVRYAEE